MKRFIASMLSILLLLLTITITAFAEEQSTVEVVPFKLGNDLLISKYHEWIDGKRIGYITNQTGVNSEGKSMIDLLANYEATKLVALYGPEHGIDGKAKAGAYVKSYTHPVLNIPVYSLYGDTRMPTEDMLRNIDVLIFDIQDIGARSYTYISTLNYAMAAAKKYNKQIIVLDRPNPVGGVIVDGPMMEEKYTSFVGIDLLPVAHGMTIGEMARFFNRKIGVDLSIVPMEGYTREMVWQDTGLDWIPTSPMISDIDAAFGYMATGIGEGTGIYQGDKFKWIGGKGIDGEKYADLLNKAGLPGVTFIPEKLNGVGGVRLKIEDYHTFNPAKTGIYALTYAYQLTKFKVPKSGKSIVMFEKIMGSSKFGEYLEKNLTPQQIEEAYKVDLERFKKEREAYLIYPTKTANAVETEVLQPKTDVPASTPSQQPAKVIVPPVPVQAPNKDEKVVYLTIDDGPSPQTERILDILVREKVLATFFVIGSNIKGREKVLKRAVQEGHVVAGHTYSHNYQTIYKSTDAFFKDLEKGNELIEKATGVSPTIIRFPGGSNNEVSKTAQDPKLYKKGDWIMKDLVKEADKRGYRYVDWNVSIGDSKSGITNTAEFMKRVKDGIKNKNEVVLLLHDAANKKSTVDALPEIIRYLKSQNYTFKVLNANAPEITFLKAK